MASFHTCTAFAPAATAKPYAALSQDQEVPPEYEDYNGHMKITHHLGLHDDAGPVLPGAERAGGGADANFRKRLAHLEQEEDPHSSDRRQT